MEWTFWGPIHIHSLLSPLIGFADHASSTTRIAMAVALSLASSLTLGSSTLYDRNDFAHPDVNCQASARGFITLPRPSSRRIALGTGFSTEIASTSSSDPFIFEVTPFDQTALLSSKLAFHQRDTCIGKYLSNETSSVAANSDHFSVHLGVTIGNKILNASVEGTYDKSLDENQDVSAY
jgi:hypothetical protein